MRILIFIILYVPWSTGWATEEAQSPNMEALGGGPKNDVLRGCVLETRSNPYMKSGYITDYKILNTGEDQIYFSVIFTFVEGGNAAYNWNLKPHGSKVWSLDTRSVVPLVSIGPIPPVVNFVDQNAHDEFEEMASAQISAFITMLYSKFPKLVFVTAVLRDPKEQSTYIQQALVFKPNGEVALKTYSKEIRTGVLKSIEGVDQNNKELIYMRILRYVESTPMQFGHLVGRSIDLRKYDNSSVDALEFDGYIKALSKKYGLVVIDTEHGTASHYHIQQKYSIANLDAGIIIP